MTGKLKNIMVSGWKNDRPKQRYLYYKDSIKLIEIGRALNYFSVRFNVYKNNKPIGNSWVTLRKYGFDSEDSLVYDGKTYVDTDIVPSSLGVYQEPEKRVVFEPFVYQKHKEAVFASLEVFRFRKAREVKKRYNELSIDYAPSIKIIPQRYEIFIAGEEVLVV